MASFSGGLYSPSGAELQSEPASGESLLWSGQPLRSVVFHPLDWTAIPFSLMWGGFALFWEYGATGQLDALKHPYDPSKLFFALWGIPFIVIGQYVIWGRFLYTAWKKGRTYYGITNKRRIILCAGSTRKVIDAYLRSLDSVSLTVRSDGVGAIEFAPEMAVTSQWGFWGLSGRRRIGIAMDIDLSRLAFLDIADARSVYQIIQSQRDKIRSEAE